jgi:hypothetical protein
MQATFRCLKAMKTLKRLKVQKRAATKLAKFFQVRSREGI